MQFYWNSIQLQRNFSHKVLSEFGDLETSSLSLLFIQQVAFSIGRTNHK